MTSIPSQITPLTLRPAPNMMLSRAPVPLVPSPSAKRKSGTSNIVPLPYRPRQNTASPATPPRATTPIPHLSPMARRVSDAMDNTFSAPQIPAQSTAPLSQTKLDIFSSVLKSESLAAATEDEPAEDDEDAHRTRAVCKFYPQKNQNLALSPDLEKSLQTLIETSINRALFHPESGLHLYLEPMLRHTVRRALAEQMETSHHFSDISATDKLTWRLKALFTSRSFNDIVFERTRRYQVMEVYLMQRGTNILISFASNDPSRHCHPNRIQDDLRHLVKDCRDQYGQLNPLFDLPENRHAIVRRGQFAYLVAIMRGDSNPLVTSDLDYALLQIEQRFEEPIKNTPKDLLRPLQPILESCLLIQSPPPPKG